VIERIAAAVCDDVNIDDDDDDVDCFCL